MERTRTGSMTDEERARYARHLTLPEVGPAGQDRLRASSALVIGIGGLGTPVATYLAAAGVGRLGVVEFDRVELGNLQRQPLYATGDVGRPKLDVAVRRLAEVNPHVRIEPHERRFRAEGAVDLVSRYDVVVDGSDNFPTRYVVNDACVRAGRANVHGSVYRFEGRVAVLAAPDAPCYRCAYPDPPAPDEIPNCAEGGVLGALPGIVGSIQAAETIKILLGRPASLAGRMLVIDALDMTFHDIRLRRDPACPACGDRPTVREIVDLPGPGCPGPSPGDEPPSDIDAVRAAERIRRGDDVLLVDVRTEVERAICHVPGDVWIPMHELGSRLSELPRDRELVLYCHHGMRSALAVAFLADRGFRHVRNLTGGIDDWAARVDPDMPRY